MIKFLKIIGESRFDPNKRREYRLWLIKQDDKYQAGKIVVYREPRLGKWTWYLQSMTGERVAEAEGNESFNTAESAVEACGKRLTPPENTHFESTIL